MCPEPLLACVPLSCSELVVPRTQREEFCAADPQSADITLEGVSVSAVGLAGLQREQRQLLQLSLSICQKDH